MPFNRRDFIRTAAAGAAAGAGATALGTTPAAAGLFDREPQPRLPDALGLLYDSTLCVGCKGCVAGCKAENGNPPEISADQEKWNPGLYDSAKGLSAKTYNIIQVYRDGTMDKKDQAENGFAFIKRQCLHCVDPSCVSCCPVTAMIKDPVTGIVWNDPDRCIGCRYCSFACPFQVPKFEFDKTFGKIKKCELCRHLLAKGELPGCVSHCPTGATLFGRVEDLRREAYRRLALKPGEVYAYPQGDISGKYGTYREPTEKVVAAAYLPEVYGEQVLGGTQTLYLSAVPFASLGLPWGNVPDHMYSTETEGIQHTLYKNMLLPAVVLAGLVTIAWRNVKRHHHEADDE